MRIIDGNIFEGMRMIIPEHRDAMLRLQKESKQQTKPILDADRFNDMSLILSESIQDQRFVTITVFKPFGNEQLRMIPAKIDPYTRTLKGAGKYAESVSVSLTDILDVQF